MARLLDALNESYEQSYNDPDRFVKLARTDSVDVTIAQHYQLQAVLRPLFGKGPPSPPSIGDHPDYIDLRRSRRRVHGAITTLFLDMEGSTKLGLVYTPD